VHARHFLHPLHRALALLLERLHHARAWPRCMYVILEINTLSAFSKQVYGQSRSRKEQWRRGADVTMRHEWTQCLDQ
jgi:hypothetical protein